MYTFTVSANVSNLPEIHKFIDKEFVSLSHNKHLIRQIQIVVEEIFSNIASYAYGSNCLDNKVSICVIQNDNEIIIEFQDSGTAYDPLSNTDPNTKLSLEERTPGGLGLFIVKKFADNLKYRYEDGKNILIVKKEI